MSARLAQLLERRTQKRPFVFVQSAAELGSPLRWRVDIFSRCEYGVDGRPRAGKALHLRLKRAAQDATCCSVKDWEPHSTLSRLVPFEREQRWQSSITQGRGGL